MVALRNLTTRFDFEVDRKGIRNFNKSVKGMKRELSKIAGLVGIAFGTKGIVDSGLALIQANVALESTLETAGNMPGAFEAVKKSINDVSFGVGDNATKLNDLATNAELMRTAFSFFGKEGIDATAESINQFQTLIEAAGALAVQTGGSVEEAFGQILSGVSGGDLEAIVPLIDLDRFGAALSEFRAQLAAGGDLFEPQTFKRNLDTLVNLIDKSAPEIQGVFKVEGIEKLLEFRDAQKTAQNAFEKLGALSVKALTPLANLIEGIATDLEVAAGNADSLGGFLANLIPPALARALGIDRPIDKLTPEQAKAEVKKIIKERAANPDPRALDISTEQTAAFEKRVSNDIEDQRLLNIAKKAGVKPLEIKVEVTADQDSFVKVIKAENSNERKTAKVDGAIAPQEVAK